jgi:hypothetical protein
MGSLLLNAYKYQFDPPDDLLSCCNAHGSGRSCGSMQAPNVDIWVNLTEQLAKNSRSHYGIGLECKRTLLQAIHCFLAPQ